MRMRSLCVAAVLVAVFGGAVPLGAQEAPAQLPPGIGKLDEVAVKGDTLTLAAGRDSLTVQVVEPNILRLHYHPNGETSPRTQVLDPDRTWSNDVPAKIETGADPITISTKAMIVKISKEPVRLTVCDRAGHGLLAEPRDGGVFGGGLRFHAAARSRFFGIDATSIPGLNLDPRQDIRSGLVRQGGEVNAGRQGDGGAPLIYTTQYGLLIDSDGGNFTAAHLLARSSFPAAPAKISNTSL